MKQAENEPDDYMEFRFKQGSYYKDSRLVVHAPSFRHYDSMLKKYDNPLAQFGDGSVSSGLLQDFGLLPSLSSFFKGGQASFMIKVEDYVRETNAKYEKEDTVVLFNMDLAKFFANPASLAGLSELRFQDRRGAQKLVDKVSGLAVDMQERIQISF